MKGRTALQIKRYGRSLLVVLALMAVGMVAGAYILIQQRLPNPFAHFYKINAAFPTAAAVVPGLGEPVDVAGVHVGEILNVQLHAGQGIVQMEVDPNKGVRHFYRNAYAVLTPTTPLDDMYIDINPGTPSSGILPSGSTIPVQQTTSPIGSDELLDELDNDTRDWFTSLITALDTGLRGRGPDIRQLLETLGPTAVQTRTIADLLAQRRTELADLVHNVGQLSKGISVDDTQLGTLLETSNRTFGALTNQDTQLRSALTQLPGTLGQTRQTLASLTGFANELTPTATALIPLARHLPRTLTDARTLVKAAAIVPLNKAASVESSVLPLGTGLARAESGLRADTPSLTTAFKGIEYITNELAYSPGQGNPGFLYWLAWFAHNVDSFVGNTDANGPAWRLVTETTCSSLTSASTITQTVLSPLLKGLGCA
ncbi:MAG TPA: MlaD family protein [Solirubrobacteraceae bacterium]|nr:MlaD family protein [Solirubrobacteraceae bacterium]